MTLYHDRVLLAINARFQITVHRIQKIVAMELRVETNDTAAQQPLQNFVAPGTNSHALGVGPRDVPEDDDGRGRKTLANHRRRQGEVIVLHQNNGILRVDFAAHRVGELLIDGAVLPPVLGAEDWSRVRVMAERPQPFVRKSVVVALLLFLG